jgi:hypothetical protein
MSIFYPPDLGFTIGDFQLKGPQGSGGLRYFYPLIKKKVAAGALALAKQVQRIVLYSYQHLFFSFSPDGALPGPAYGGLVQLFSVVVVIRVYGLQFFSIIDKI